MLKPKLFMTMKNYNKAQLLSDLSAGVIVGIIAIPLAIAFSIASGVSPEKGLYTAIIAGFVISFFGGSRVQIGGPTGAFVVIIYGIVEKYGTDGLMIATIMAGIILIVMGLIKLGTIIQYVPHPLIVGFTSGIAVIIFSSQIKDFLGLTMQNVPSHFLEKWGAYFSSIHTINYYALAIAMGSVFIIVYWKYISEKIPGSLVALILSTVAAQIFNLPVETIGSRFGEIPSSLPAPTFPNISFDVIQSMISPAIAIALLGGIESLLSAVVADGMIGGKHRSNMELVAQGIANIASPIFGGIPATGAIARTAANVKNGGRTPIAGITHAIVLLLVLLFLGKLAALIPLSCLAAVLVVVAYNMSEWRSFIAVLKSPKSDMAVLLATFGLTVIFDLVIAIEVGMVMAAFLFMRRMAMVTNVNVLNVKIDEEEDENDPYSIQKIDVPKGVEVYEIDGPFFFGAADKFKEAMLSERPPKVRIVRMRKVPAIDSTGLHALKEVFKNSKKDGTTLIISGIKAQPFEALKQSGLLAEIGENNVFTDINEALARAKQVLGIKPVSFSDLIKKGGIFYNIEGHNVLEVTKNAIKSIPTPAKISKDKILHYILEREEMMPTAIGQGIAIPHSRNPIISDINDESISICFLEKPVDYQAIDGELVHTLFVVLSSRPKRHLEILSKIAGICRDAEFVKLLNERASKQKLIDYLIAKEEKN